MSKPRFLCMAMLVTMLIASTATAETIVSLLPAEMTVVQGQPFTVDIIADLGSEFIVGWGLDVTPSSGSVLSSSGSPIIGPSWDAAYAPDGDALAALAPAASGSVTGDNVLLAKLSFVAVAEGETDLVLSDDNPTDLTEGFALDPTGFADVQYIPAHITVIPEPMTGLLVILGLIPLLRKRCSPFWSR